jgi:D-alanyl-D-alanine carboxypeptidase/D-alanyl-D-alanine-endopeptidase (penicillin-binding protein 4)
VGGIAPNRVGPRGELSKARDIRPAAPPTGLYSPPLGGLDGATLTPQNPLAGITRIAQQVRRSGITRVEGNVIVDNRLFQPEPVFVPVPTPLIINDNLIDLLTTPGARAGAPARLDWRPRVAPYRVTSTVRTVAAGEPTGIEVTTSDNGTRIHLSGTIAADTGPALKVSPIADPAAFGRTALIEALGRAGVKVTENPTGANPVGQLPGSYEGRPRVALYTSPPSPSTPSSSSRSATTWAATSPFV